MICCFNPWRQGLYVAGLWFVQGQCAPRRDFMSLMHRNGPDSEWMATYQYYAYAVDTVRDLGPFQVRLGSERSESDLVEEMHEIASAVADAMQASSKHAYYIEIKGDGAAMIEKLSAYPELGITFRTHDQPASA
jgi:hypothetical protein